MARAPRTARDVPALLRPRAPSAAVRRDRSGPVRALAGAAVLAVGVRVVDRAVDLLVARRSDAAADATGGAAVPPRAAVAPAVVLEQLVRATLLGAVMAVAVRSGLPRRGADRRRA